MGSLTTMGVLVPAHYVTAARPGPGFTITTRRTGGPIGLFPPCHPAPPHAISLPQVERSLAGLADAPDDDRGFEISYPVFALRRPSGDYLGYGPDGDRPGGKSFGIAVFTTEAGAVNFLRSADRRSRWHRGRTRLRVEAFDRAAVFRRFLRSVRDAGTFVLFDPVCGPDGHLYADHAFPAAVVLEQFLPQIRWGWSYPLYVMRSVTLGNVLAATEGQRDDGTRVTVLPVFTDADLADRALVLTSQPMTVVPIPDAETFVRVIGELQPGTAVAFDPDPARSAVAKTVMFRDDLLAHLEDLEL